VPKKRLTDITLRQLSQEQGQTRYFDEALPGFGVTVGTRTKTFFVMRGEKRQLTTIGKYPEISLSDARKAAKRLLVQEATESSPTRLLDAVGGFLADCEARLRPSSVAYYRLALRSAPDIAISDATKRNLPATTPPEVKSYKALFNWCMREELTDRNPFQHSKVTFNQRSRVLTDEEIKAIWTYDYPPFSDIIKLCILTGQRRGEISQFNAAWIENDTITIPSTVTKNSHEHVFPFNMLTAYYLKRYVGHTWNGWSKGKLRIDKHVPIPPWTIHDLRRTFSTTHARLGTPLHVTEKLLNHVSGTVSGVAAIYNRHNYLKEMRRAALDYELHIANVVGAKA
jgi:integrase